MRTILAASTLVPPAHSGAGKRIVAQLSQLAALGWRCEIWTTTPASSTLDYKLRQFPLPNKKTYLRYAIYLFKIFIYALMRLYGEKEIVVYGSARCKISLAIMAAAAILRVPFVVGSTLNGFDDINTLSRIAGGRLILFLLRRAYAWVSISPVLIWGFDQIKGFRATLIPNHVDTNKFAPCHDMFRQVLRHNYSIEEKLCVISIGAVSRRKGTIEIIKAFAAATPEDWNGVLFIVGPFSQHPDQLEYHRECLSLVNEFNLQHCIHFLGIRNDVDQLLKAADIFIHMSESEGFPTVIIEAMACGLPLVVKEIIGVTDYIFGDKVPQLLKIHEHNENVGEIIRKLAVDQQLRTDYGILGRARVLEEFDRDKIIKKYNQLLSDALTYNRY